MQWACLEFRPCGAAAYGGGPGAGGASQRSAVASNRFLRADRTPSRIYTSTRALNDMTACAASIGCQLGFRTRVAGNVLSWVCAASGGGPQEWQTWKTKPLSAHIRQSPISGCGLIKIRTLQYQLSFYVFISAVDSYLLTWPGGEQLPVCSCQQADRICGHAPCMFSANELARCYAAPLIQAVFAVIGHQASKFPYCEEDVFCFFVAPVPGAAVGRPEAGRYLPTPPTAAGAGSARSGMSIVGSSTSFFSCVQQWCQWET